MLEPLEVYASTSQVNIDGFVLEFDSSTGTITKCISGEGALNIPEKINGVAVKSIGDFAFRDCTGLTSINIPNGVTSIGSSAFAYCNKLTSISIPNSVTLIDNRAFYHCFGLTSISIPNSVTSIGDSAFSGCSGLTSINVDSSNPNYTSKDGILFSKDLKTLVAYPGRKTGAYTIPSSVTSISVGAFYECTGLTSISIPSSVTSIDAKTFNNCTGLTSITIPNSVTSIGDYAFNNCSGLTSITIPNSVTSIGDYAFWSCTGLTSITIPNSVTSIGIGGFNGCTGLTSINIPNSVTSIGDSAFFGCSELKDIYYPGTQSQWNAIDKSYAGIPEDARIHYNSNNNNNNSSLSFTDVSSSANYYEALKYLVEKGIINGTTDTTFSPNDVMTRATLVVMLYRMEGSPATIPVTFTDVPAGSWYASAIAWAKNLGLVNGTGDGSTFSPDDALTKEQVVAIIDRYYTSKSYNLSDTKFGIIADSSQTSSWASDSVNKMYKIGILNTDSSNNFNPTSKATRSDVAYMLGNLLLKVN